MGGLKGQWCRVSPGMRSTVLQSEDPVTICLEGIREEYVDVVSHCLVDEEVPVG